MKAEVGVPGEAWAGRVPGEASEPSQGSESGDVGVEMGRERRGEGSRTGLGGACVWKDGQSESVLPPRGGIGARLGGDWLTAPRLGGSALYTAEAAAVPWGPTAAHSSESGARSS